MIKYNRPDGRYPENWNRLRHAIFHECGYRCQKCQRYAKGELHLHHIVPIGLGGSNNRYNLIPLCKDCHYAIHFKKGTVKL